MNFAEMVLVTGRGFPDCATHRLLARIRDSKEDIEFYYLGDYDPHGFQICLTYRRTLPQLKWIGILLAQINHFQVAEHQMPLTERETRLLSNLILRADDELQLAVEPAHQVSLGVLLSEVEHMIELSWKCEIEAFNNQALCQIISFL